jgi:hypothetical protein
MRSWFKEGKNAVQWTKLSCHDFVDNQVRLQLFVLASVPHPPGRPQEPRKRDRRNGGALV